MHQVVEHEKRFTGSDDFQVATGSAGELPFMVADVLRANSHGQRRMSVRDQVNSMVGWVFVCVTRICEGVAKTPLNVYATQRGAKPSLVDDPNNDLVKLLRRPNPRDTLLEFWEQTVTFFELTGNAIWLKERDRLGVVRELWPIPTQFIYPRYRSDGQPPDTYMLQDGHGGAVPIPATEIVHHKRANPTNRFWGLGRLQAAAAALRSQDAIKSAQLESFANDILASLFFSTEKDLSDPAWERMMATLIERHGRGNTGVPVLLYGGVKPVPSYRAPAEMQFRDSSMITRDEILSIFGVLPVIAGIVEHANTSNTASQERVFGQYTLAPICCRIHERINLDLSPEFGEQYLAEFDSPVPSDEMLDARIAETYIRAGVIEPNVVREQLGLEPTEWGAAPRWVLEMEQKVAEAEAARAAAEKAAQEAAKLQKEQQQPQQGAGTPQADQDDSEPVEPDEAPGDDSAGRGYRVRSLRRLSLRGLLVRSISKDFDELAELTTPTIRKFFAKQATRIAENVERIFSPLVSPDPDKARSLSRGLLQERVWCVTGEGETFARLYPDGSTVRVRVRDDDGVLELGRACDVPSCCYHNGVWQVVNVRRLTNEIEESLDNWEAAADELAGRMLSRLEKAMREGGDMQLAQIGLDGSFSMRSPEAEEWLRNKRRDYWNSTVNETTKRQLSDRIAALMEAGPTMADIMAAVEEVMAGRIQSSSEVIARTETIGAYNAGSELVRSQNGIEQKEWIATLDSRTRLTHLEADGQVVQQAAKFSVGGEQLAYPGDPAGSVSNIVRCRCAAVAVLDD